MGNNKTKGQKGDRSDIQPKKLGDVFIQTEKSSYFAGEFISGKIYLNVIEEGFPGCIVYLNVTGKEKCEWTEKETTTTTDQNGNQIETTTTQTYTGLSQIYQHKVEIHNFENLLQPLGQFVFPFQFQLLSHLPGSYYEKDLAQISYKVKALVQSKQSSFNFIKHSQKLIITEPLSQFRAAKGQAIDVTSQKCCFKRKGACQVQCFIDKFNFLPGDEVNLTIDMDNSSLDQPVHSLSIRLYNHLYLNDNENKSVRFNRIKASQSIEGVAAKGKKQLNLKFFLRNNNPHNELLPSVNGKLIQSEYELSISVNVESDCCCKKFSTIDFPIQIFAPAIQSNDPILQEPPHWNPQVFQNQKVCLIDRNKQYEDQHFYPNHIGSQIQQMQSPMQD